jgi:hypothetical protein
MLTDTNLRAVDALWDKLWSGGVCSRPTVTAASATSKRNPTLAP